MVRTGRLILAMVPAAAAMAQQTVPRSGDSQGPSPDTESAVQAAPLMFDDALSATGLIARSSRGRVAAAREVIPLEQIERGWCPGADSSPAFSGPGDSWTYADHGGRWMQGITMRLRADAPLTVVEAYSATGVLIGRVIGGASSTLRLDFPGSIGRVVIRELYGSATLGAHHDQAATCPAPGEPAMLGLFLAVTMCRRRIR